MHRCHRRWNKATEEATLSMAKEDCVHRYSTSSRNPTGRLMLDGAPVSV